ncbi:unnamed protein product [Aspergillus oryzae RIB40]|uniref:DNA, SC005 n=2 Tax=Aspergillus oryzae TaxID=5062 RepID=Q2USK6_ASPOR|nr:unnamed protein product [Aspergillus oryzae RIB40]EIT77500.1 hypothetical protein Ao3042_06285 [Aspergillus oryzae 3.042]KDE76872.1 hypothetical protein AO1008_02779 [Aspergillus oryzae 100-8]BAE55459.1 unnamed protein product [Aspergillus oryzae RIB40]|eukprot:EIT77500.1 hypothetical protein Ao3042_06285 [Aspergillus oryzae 3.042]
MLLTASKVLGITEVLDILNCILSTDKKKKGTQSTSPKSNNLVKVSCRHTLHISIPLVSESLADPQCLFEVGFAFFVPAILRARDPSFFVGEVQSLTHSSQLVADTGNQVKGKFFKDTAAIEVVRVHRNRP